MKRTVVVVLLLAMLSSGCVPWLQRETPVAVACPPPPPAPGALTTRSASTGISTSAQWEKLIEERDGSLTNARR